MTKTASDRFTLRIRLKLGPDIALGPGKADLLEGIRDTGSIAAAGRRMKMSYKRAWLLIETMNRNFAEPLVETSKGGAGHGGAVLTETGLRVLGLYRSIEAQARAGSARDIDALEALLSDMSNRK
ncbi:winged helix-turn-helix domain-containing protein [Pararhizobium haloflavum]|uniref:winged helix-turn-helix domain-containing protein n=1 Tax=Pararhizobium haloflavum TaxID=2037914 RepID=UPI000C181070|nr:winged helix-turn-helix domain-containing protein [Pararhizobium haloflavum]